METLLDELPLDKISTSMTINATASILLALYLVVAEKRGVGWDKVNGTIQNDILKEYVARGTYIYPPRGSMRIITDIFAFATEGSSELEHDLDFRLPHPRGRLDRGAGTRVHDRRRHRIRRSRAQSRARRSTRSRAALSFFFNVHNNFFEEIAKFRAARRLWARIMKERFDAKDERSMMMRFHAQTAGSTLTAQQVDNNVVRVTLQALAAVLGGAQSLHTNSKDEALALPTESSVLLALRTQQVIAHESGVADTIDPLGGSYYVETLTDELEAKARRISFEDRRLRRRGRGDRARLHAARDSERGLPLSARDRNQAAHHRRASTSLLRAANRREISCRSIRTSSRSRRRSVAQVRAERNAETAAKALARVEAAARDGDNLMPPIVDAIRGWCTLGEISDAMRTVFGEYSPVNTV